MIIHVEKKNHISNKNVKYIRAHTKNISRILNPYKKKLMSFFILVNFLEFIKVF